MKELIASATVLLCVVAQAGDWAQFRGPGSSSPIVWGDRLFISCYSGYGVEGSTGNIDDLKRILLCIHPANGTLLWSKVINSTAAEDPWRGFIQEHGYASSTPADM